MVSGSVMVLSSMLVQVRVNSSSTFMADSSVQSRRRWSWRELQGVSCRSFTRFQNPVAKIFVKNFSFIFRILNGNFSVAGMSSDVKFTSGDLRECTRTLKNHQQGDNRTKLCTIRTKLCKFFTAKVVAA
jgi:hypothetical protein